MVALGVWGSLTGIWKDGSKEKLEVRAEVTKLGTWEVRYKLLVLKRTFKKSVKSRKGR